MAPSSEDTPVFKLPNVLKPGVLESLTELLSSYF
jgi:hypothetical protein